MNDHEHNDRPEPLRLSATIRDEITHLVDQFSPAPRHSVSAQDSWLATGKLR